MPQAGDVRGPENVGLHKGRRGDYSFPPAKGAAVLPTSREFWEHTYISSTRTGAA